MNQTQNTTGGRDQGLAGPEPGQAGGAGSPATSRRRVLQAGLAAAAALGAGGWAWPSGRRPAGLTHGAATAAVRLPGSLPYPELPAGTDTLPQVKHVVVLMMENHSYDNHLGMLGRKGADGFTLGPGGKPTATNPYANGRTQHAFRMPTTCQLTGKPSQTWTDSHTQLAGGKMNGFVKSGSGPVAMGYWDKADLPFYHSLASTFPIADRYFCSVLGQTFPNRRYLLAATSMGMINDGVPDPFQYPAGGTIFDRLHDAGVSFADYYSPLVGFLPVPTAGLYPKLLVRYHGQMKPIDHFFDDAKNGRLPGFCLVEPNYLSGSEEDPQNIAYGEQFAAKVIDAVMTGPGWGSTLLIWTFDEPGGYYDHVVPPAAPAPDNIGPDTDGSPAYTGFKQYGFRVPCAVISPWARKNYVSHRVFDHSSICALAEAKWNLPAMTHRDARANNMLDMISTKTPAFKHPPKLAKPLLDVDRGALKCNITGPGKIPPPGSVT